MKKRLLILVLFFTGCVHMPHSTSPREAVLTPVEHVTLGNAYLQQDQKDLAIRQYQDALSLDGKYVPALMALGNLAFEDKDWKKAEAYFQKAHKAAPKDAAAINNLAMVYLEQGKDLGHLDIEAEDAVGNAGPAAPYLWDTLGRIATRQGRFDDAEFALEHAAETAPPQDPVFQKHLQESRDQLASAAKDNP